MPYIVTTTLEADNVVADALESVGTRVLFSGTPRVTRRAVATLEEARNPIDAAVPGLVLPEFGGTIGPLPDGTVIVVEPIGAGELMERTLGRICGNHMLTAAIDAFNAAQV